MDILGRIKHWALMPRRGAPWRREFSHTRFLKLLGLHDVGGLVLGRYLTDPEERPDHVFRHDCRFRTYTQGDFETTRLTVERITPDEDAMLERSPGNPPQEHLVALMDRSGNILTLDYLTEADAQRVMDLAGAGAAVRSDKQDE